MSGDTVVASPQPRTVRAGWGWLLLSTVSRFYLVLVAALAACALLPMAFGLSGAVVQSGSMEPHIHAGDVVLSDPLLVRAPAPLGRVVTFRAPRGSAHQGEVLHRLVAINSNGSLVTKGDANRRPDSTPIARRDIISKACILVPWVGLPSYWVADGAFLPLGIWLLLTMGALMVGAVDAASEQPPQPRAPPNDPEPPSGSGRDPDCQGEAITQPAIGSTRPQEETIPSLLNRFRNAHRPNTAGLVAMLSVVALALSPLGLAGAAFSSRTFAAGNSWATSGPATRLAFTASPSGSTAGIAFATQPVVTVLDAGGNTVNVSSASVALSITNPAGATLACTANPVTANAGVATFDGCSIDTAGTYTLTAASSGLTNAVSTSFMVSAASATKLAFTTSPSSSTGGIAFATQPVVAVQDAAGHTVSASSAPVALSITTPAGATLTCTANRVNASAGVARFAGCSIDKAGTYTLTAISSGLTNAISTTFSIGKGPAVQLAFTTSPSSSTGGTVFGTQPVVAVQDAGGNTVSTSTVPVALSITTPAGATLACAVNPVSAAAGVATFAGCKIDKAGTYTLTAASSGLTSALTTSFTIATGPASKLVFYTNPSSGSVGGTAFTTQPVVAVQDAGGNPVNISFVPVTLSLTTPAGATLTCNANPVNAVSGLATFAGCSINKTGTYTLTAVSSGLTSAVSTSITISAGPAATLAFTTNPTGSTGGIAFATQPVVTVQDAGGNTVTGSTASVSLTITTPAGATLTCTANPTNAVAGVATFAGCSIDKAGTYTLTASAGGLTSGVSTSLTIAVGPASQVGFTTSPSGATGGTAFPTQPVVAVQDAGGNTVTGSTTSVTLSITTAGGATLTCTANPTNAIAGVATFAGCKIDKTGTYTLTASAGGLTSGVSTSLTVTAGAATKLGFTTSPSGATGGTAFATQPAVAVQDAGGNTVTTSTAAVTLTITTPAGATLTCTANPTNAVAGVATFAGCKINKIGTYTLTAAATGLTSGVSTSFTVSAGPAFKLAFTTSPSSSTGGVAFGTQPVVTVQDAGGNTATSSTAPVALSITGATLTCTTNPLGAVAGVATFGGCSINKTGTYTLTAASSGLTSAVSSSVTITVGPASRLGFTTSPSSGVTSVIFSTQPVVAVQDAGGNTVTSSSASVTLTITTPAGATLSCLANPKPASSGVAAFGGCMIDTAGSYTLTAAASGLTNAVSNSFTIAGAATKLGFTTSPSGSTASNTAFASQPVVTVQDANGYRVTNSTLPITLSITTPAGATLTCTAKTINASAGIASFSGCKIDKAGTYTLTAVSGSFTGLSGSFTITPGSANKLAFSTSPSSSTSGAAFGTQPLVAVQDAAGNTTTGTNPVTLTITTAGGATLTCTANPVNAVSGLATYAGCSINKTGTYTLTATSSGLASGVSASFSITAGPAAQLTFSTSPSNSSAGAAFGTQPVVTVQDASGNTATTSTAPVTLTITTPAGATLACAANPKNAVAGAATFSGCSINTSGTYTLTAASSGLTNAVSTGFTITAPATKLAFTTSPSNSSTGAAFGTQPVVTVQDASGNTVVTSSASVTLSVTPPGGSTLTCNANPVNAVAGVAVFAGCNLSVPGTYTLTANASGLTAAVTNSFTITGG